MRGGAGKHQGPMGVKNESIASRQRRFEHIAMPHSRSLLRMALRLANCAWAAEDLVQQALLQAWRGFDGFHDGTDARAWLFRILLNAFYAQGRKLRTAPTVIQLTVHDEEATSHPGSTAAFQAITVVQAFRALSLEHRTVLHLSVVEGFRCREIAGILSVPFGTVMSRLSRARQALRDQIAGGTKKLCESGVAAGSKKRR
jgi:RNA polymerase sigma-70 factor, ECF subfamily